MAGIKEWFRNRSRSRSRRSEEIQRDRPPPAEQASAPPLPPLPLLRPDSSYSKPLQQPQQEVKSRPVSEVPASRNRERRSRDSAADDTLSIASSSYSSVTAGAPPATGTYPLHGNSTKRFPSQSGKRSGKSPGRTSSISSSHYRQLSGASADERHSVPPGTALSIDIPISATDAPRQSSSRSRQPGATPMDPYVPDPYLHGNGSSKGFPGTSRSHGDNPANERSSPRTPIAEQFSSPRSAWLQQETSVIDSTSPKLTNGFTEKENTTPHTLRHQPDINDLSGKVNSQQIVDIPQRQSSLGAAQDFRGRLPQRPSDRPLPVPKELENAPWNRKEPIPIDRPLQFDGSASSRDIDGELANGVAPLSLQERQKPQDVSPDINLASDVGLPEPSPINETESFDPSSEYATPMFEVNNNSAINPFTQAEVRQGPQTAYNKKVVVKDAAQPPSLKGVVDLSNTEDTSVHTRYAPAVTHEVIKPEVHHIREERITREIHTHETHHRILPIIDVQVLPAKHFVPSADGRGFVEVAASQIPGRALDDVNNRNWVIAETVSRALAPESKVAKEPRKFTARAFEGTDGDYIEETGADGVLRTKTTWVHPPTIDEGAKKRGLTVPLEMD